MSISLAISGITNLISEAIEDPDKQAELNAKVTEALLSTSTTPKTDATVKLMIAFRDIILPLLRPAGGFLMTAFGMYMHYRGTPMDTGLQAAFDLAFPGWMTSRHINKNEEQKTKRVLIDTDD